MNFFFGFKNTLFNSELIVPRFQNCGKTRDNYSLFSAEIDKGKWLIKNISENLYKTETLITHKSSGKKNIEKKQIIFDKK